MTTHYKKILGIAALLLAPAWAGASQLTLSPAAATYEPAHTYTVSVYMAPAAGEKVYTVKAALALAGLDARSFTFASGWLPLTQPGYDSLSASQVIKTAGYPGGLTSATLLGTLTVYAPQPGSGSITVTSASQALGSSNQDTLVSRGSLAATIAAPIAAPATPKAPTVPAKTTSPSRTPAATVPPTKAAPAPAPASTTTTASAQAPAPAQVAAVAQAPVSPKLPLFYLLAGVALAALGYALGRHRSAA